MYEQNIQQVKEVTETKNKLERVTWRLGVVCALGATAVTAKHGLLPDGSIENSLAHPILGYVGAAVGVWSAKHTKLGHKTSAFVGATVVNSAAEVGQELLDIGDGTNLVSGENVKDYTFAVAGLGLYALSEKILSKKA